MKVVKAAEAHESPNPHGVSSKMLLNSEAAQVVMITMQPGQELKRHITPVDVLFYGLEGQGLVEIGDEQAAVAPDTLVDSPARIPHRLLNNSAAPFRFLVVKTPGPKEPTKIL